MSGKLRLIITAALAVIFIDILVMGVKIFDGNYDFAVEGVVGFIGFTVIGGCGVAGLYRELKKRAHNKKGQL